MKPIDCCETIHSDEVYHVTFYRSNEDFYISVGDEDYAASFEVQRQNKPGKGIYIQPKSLISPNFLAFCLERIMRHEDTIADLIRRHS